MNLKEQLIAKVEGAQKALAAGDVERAKTLRAEAEKLAEMIREEKALEGLTKDLADAARPPLPGQGEGTTPQPKNENEKENPVVNLIVKSAVGQVDRDVELVLRDLYGADYNDILYNHRRAFQKYLRAGELALSGDEIRMLKTVVFTPDAVKDALLQGYDLQALKTTMVEASDVLGGYIVPLDFQARVIQRVAATAIIRQRAQVVRTSHKRVEFPLATGGNDQYPTNVRVTWVDETPTAGTADTNLTWGRIGIDVNTVMAEATVTRDLVEDAAFNLETYLVRALGEAVAIDEDNQFLTGNGAGRPYGLLPDSGNGLGLTEVNSGNASALTWDGLINLVYAIPSQYRQNAVWIMNRNTVRDIRKLKDSSGNYLWDATEFRGGAGGQQPTLLGFPVLEHEGMPDVGANAYPIIFGDLSGYFVVDRVGMSIERFLDSSTARQNQIIFLLRRRVGGRAVETWRFAVQKVAA